VKIKAHLTKGIMKRDERGLGGGCGKNRQKLKRKKGGGEKNMGVKIRGSW